MVFGFGSTPRVLGTREIEECLNDNIADLLEGDEAWIITPYATMGALGHQRRALAEASKRGAHISFVVRDETAQVGPAERDLAEACSNGMRLYRFHRLHAKLYWFAHGTAIVTSANLVDGSFESSTEIGIFVPGGGLHEQLREWIRKEIEPGLKPIVAPGKHGTSGLKIDARSRGRVGASANHGGHCIRCGKNIPRDLDKPYCLEHFKSWAVYSNPEYEEKHCHLCGRDAKTSMMRPRCYACFKERAG